MNFKEYYRHHVIDGQLIRGIQIDDHFYEPIYHYDFDRLLHNAQEVCYILSTVQEMGRYFNRSLHANIFKIKDININKLSVYNSSYVITGDTYYHSQVNQGVITIIKYLSVGNDGRYEDLNYGTRILAKRVR